MGAVQQGQSVVHVPYGTEVVVGVGRGADGGVDAAADHGELTSQVEQGREDVRACGSLQLAGGGVDVDAGLHHGVLPVRP